MKDFSPNFTPNRFQTGRLSRFGVKCRLFGGGERGVARTPTPTNAHQRTPTHTNIRHTINALENRKSPFIFMMLI
ncbi:transposase-like protein [Corynebacterium diphtheriae BH8]|nr:transposase-like protein [Corynebacterium diphtheriae BH8]